MKITVLSLSICISIVHSAGIDHLPADLSWPKHADFGQLSAVSVDKRGKIYVFHRGDRKWDQNTFDDNDCLADTSAGPIPEKPIVILNDKGGLIAAAGNNQFYMPHGLTVDDDLNIWVTDVGLHQVIKYPPFDFAKSDLLDPILTLGTALQPGKGNNKFCKPTSVAIELVSKDFFVADGYCNSRIVKFDKKGKFLIEWGKRTPSFPILLPRALGPYNLNVPHSLAIDNARQHLIVADRENFRILFYTVDGKFVQVLPMRSRVYGVSYSPIADTIQAVTGGSRRDPGMGIILSLRTNNVSALFGNFRNAHDVAVSPAGQSIYVVETDPFVFSRFTVDNASTQAADETKVRRVNPVGSPPESANSVPEQVDVSSGDTKAGGVGFEPISTLGMGANQAALSIVTASVLLAVIALTCHLRKQKARALPMERRGLILEDDDER